MIVGACCIWSKGMQGGEEEQEKCWKYKVTTELPVNVATELRVAVSADC